jgi:hypothetical protein
VLFSTKASAAVTSKLYKRAANGLLLLTGILRSLLFNLPFTQQGARSNRPLTTVMVSLNGDMTNRSDPLGARLIMAAIELAGGRVTDLLEDRITTREEIARAVDRKQPDFLCVSCQPSSPELLPYLHKLRHAANDAPLVAGNLAAANLSDDDLLSLVYDRWVNPLFWTPAMRARARLRASKPSSTFQVNSSGTATLSSMKIMK